MMMALTLVSTKSSLLSNPDWIGTCKQLVNVSWGALLDLLPMRMQPLVHLAAVTIAVEKLPQQTPILEHQHIDFDNWLSIVL